VSSRVFFAALDAILILPMEPQDPDDKPKKTWKAGRKPKQDSYSSKLRGSDYVGGMLAIRDDAKLDVAERDDPAYKKFSEMVGGKDGLREMAAWSENPKAQKLLELIDDNRFKTYGIKALAKRCGMTLPELCNLFRERYFLEMYLKFFSSMPKIAEGVIEDAQPGTDVCPMCGGEQYITRNDVTKPCPKCSGSGKVRTPGDKEARRDVFKAVGIHKESSTNITQIGNVTVEGVDDFEELMKSTKTSPILTVKKGQDRSGKETQESEAQDAEIVEG
jgi:hypothetical protein